MRYYFIMNPASGSKGARDRFFEGLETLKIPFRILKTTRSGDATVFARDICESALKIKENVRIFACGGDGTFNEVVNGCIGFDNVEIGAIPFGTGNDFVRNFADASQYLDVLNYARSYSLWCDAIDYELSLNGQVRTGYCANMVNIGLDCQIADLASDMKKIPLVNGSLAYLLAVFYKMLEKKGTDLKITYDNGEVYDNKLLLISIANGCYCGGGIKGLPLADLQDGVMDSSLVKFVTRRDFIRIFPMYSKGTHLDSDFVKNGDIIDYRQLGEISIKSNCGPEKICIDGEISEFDKARFKIREKAFRFIVP